MVILKDIAEIEQRKWELTQRMVSDHAKHTANL
jgi:hypothetical protein